MENKTEKATPKKRQDERKKGNVFQSKEIVTLASLGAGFLILSLNSDSIGKTLQIISIKYFSAAQTIPHLDSEQLRTIFLDIISVTGQILLPIALIIISAVLVATLAQTRFLFSKESLKPKFSKLNPISGMKRVFSTRSIMEVLKAILKITLFVVCFYNFILSKIGDISVISGFSHVQLIGYIISSASSLIVTLMAYFAAVSVLDFAYQKWEYEKNIMMSKQDIKQEHKQQEGDPQIKGKIREIQRQMASGRMMQNVPSADVIIRNPTHFAVALKFDIDKKMAPVVVAKGMDDIAFTIIKIAQEHKVPMTENKELARALYKDVALNAVIPQQYYEAVAKVLAWVYSTRKKGLGDNENI